MEFSWTSLKISIAGAKLSHLSRKDKIWDHGSMTEQARIIFYLVCKAKDGGNIELLKKQCTSSCFEKLRSKITEAASYNDLRHIGPIIKEIAIIDVQAGKQNKPDRFRAVINGIYKDSLEKKFKAQCDFVRQGDWWVLDDLK